MPNEIYNEGRVVGMSAYELYLRHQLGEYPEMETVTEREWLAATIGSGCSLIMKLDSGTPAGIVDKPLPDHSTLCACGSIVASVFDGEIATDSTNTWATHVVSYGQLIRNDASSHPVSPGQSVAQVPVGTEWTTQQLSHLKEYLKVIDGVIYQPGDWEASQSGTPFMDLKSPDLTQQGRIRLKVAETLSSDVYILISGFTHKPVVAGTSKIEEGSISEIHPWNGDFLGPERFPWAVKISFTLSSDVFHLINNMAYSRELPRGTPAESIRSKSIIDMNATNIEQFYAVADSTSYSQPVSNSRIPTKVTELNVTDDHASVLSIYQRHDASSGSFSGTDYPPALYGSKVVSKGDQQLMPVDTAAPGTVKVFDNKDKAAAYPKIIPNTYAMWHDKENKGLFFVDGDTYISMGAEVSTVNLGSVESPKYTSIVKSGGKQVNALSLSDENGNMFGLGGGGGVANAYNYITWDVLIAALGRNLGVDVLGDHLKQFRKALPTIKTTGTLEIDGKNPSYVSGPFKAERGVDLGSVGGYNIRTTETYCKFNQPVQTGRNFIVTGKGLRFYISTTSPGSDDGQIPIGSVGVGW